MKITICGSTTFLDKIIDARLKLYEAGCDVKIPLPEEDEILSDLSVENRFNVLKDHFDSIYHSNAILVLNFDKKGVKGYIGSSTLIEIGVAFFLNKKIFILNPLPKLALRDEIEAMKPIILNGKLENIKEYI
jgi:hypothetical protein